ncbi:MAG: SDR family NAD(P)-dependent oxidoreductase [Pseudomonadota bacterium]
MRQVLITGHSSGLGEALARYHLETDDAVLGISRRRPALTDDALISMQCDLADTAALEKTLSTIESSRGTIHLAYLNAGVLQPFRDMVDTPLQDIRAAMEVNVWANKIILDWMCQLDTPPEQVVLVSSGAGVNGNRGWGSYALSKATLNMLTQLYRDELPATHLCALAPGLIHTAMQDYIKTVDATRFSSTARLQQAMGTAGMPPPEIVAQRIGQALSAIRNAPSGSYLDLRELTVNPTD